MSARKDAGVALVKFLAGVEETFPKIAGPRTVWTAGDIKLDPGAPSIVPGRAELIFQWRDTDQGILDRLDEAFHALLAEANKGPCTATVASHSVTMPAIMDPALQAALAASAQKHAPGLHQAMPSGAGHDAQIVSQVLPSAMLFIPSIGGISHHWTENTCDEDIVLGCQVFADAAESVLSTV